MPATALGEAQVKYSDLMVEWLVGYGYTHCFFVAGGNSMHLLDAVRRQMTCIPVVHEVTAGIAAEYFNESGGAGLAFVLVTAGPGMTNLVTALAGAFLESRDLLVLGGQVKAVDLARGAVRQRGIQEVDGVAIAGPVTVIAERIEQPVARDVFLAWVDRGRRPRKGPVFLEVCLDAQATMVDRAARDTPVPAGVETAKLSSPGHSSDVLVAVSAVRAALDLARRPVLLIGGGVSRVVADRVLPKLRELAVPAMTTWNAADRFGADEGFYVGRPNTWGQRSANVILQQADLVIALGSRLGLQQTGFNWKGFAPLARVFQVDVDEAELTKGHPRLDRTFAADADAVLEGIAEAGLPRLGEWLEFCRDVRRLLPVVEASNVTGPGYVCPYQFVADLSARCTPDDVIVPCSSGGAFTVTMQTFRQRRGQVIITDKGLASMGYGLGGAIGGALAHPGRRTVLIDGDGGFAQNVQDLATVVVNGLQVKIFLFSNEGYSSIRMTQRNYFGGQYLGCDTSTGLGFPHWPTLFESFGIPVLELDASGVSTDGFDGLFEASGPAAFVVPVDPEQTYYPKIASRVTAAGGMESQPIHLMSPDLTPSLARRVLLHIGPLEE